MNDGYYVSYLEKSSSYRNLEFAYTHIQSIVRDLNDLKEELSKGSGDYVQYFDLIIELEIGRLKDNQKLLRKQQAILKANATKFDGILNEWKNKIGTVYNTYIPNGYLSSSTRSTYKTQDKIKSVSVSNNGYINVEFEQTKYTYYVNIGQFQYYSCSNWINTHSYNSKSVTTYAKEYNFDGKPL